MRRHENFCSTGARALKIASKALIRKAMAHQGYFCARAMLFFVARLAT
jgi:hypothetical protein